MIKIKFKNGYSFFNIFLFIIIYYNEMRKRRTLFCLVSSTTNSLYF